MKKTILTFVLTSFLFACSEEKKTEEVSTDSDGMHITVHDDSTDADVKVNANGIHVKTNDGKEADVKIDANGTMDIKSSEGDATVKMDKNGNMDIKTKDGDASVKMDKSGNMQIKGPDGKEINVKIPTDAR
ncbi:MAG: hypothetical protein IT257_01540 [Chitinophagaceae bacterium]|nr:hypothetical protein [Chitinophagaceae bacterium]